MLLNAGRGCEGKYPVCPAEEERVGSPREPEGQAGQQLHCLDPAGRAYLSWVAVWVGPGGVEVGALQVALTSPSCTLPPRPAPISPSWSPGEATGLGWP